ncbi:unnamed protein product [Brassica oleracea]
MERELSLDKWLLFPQKDIGELLASTQIIYDAYNTLRFKISSIHLSSIINNYQYSKMIKNMKNVTKKLHMKMMILVMFQQRQIKLRNIKIGWKLIVRTKKKQ